MNVTHPAAAAAPATTPGPLDGLKVLELGQLIAGPFVGKTLADFGADVVKVEPPEGDPLRQWRMLRNGTSVWWQVQSRGKKSVVLDLRSTEGRESVRALAAEADVLIENFKPGTMEKWGLGWDELSAINPGLIMLRISGYGQTGPYRDLPGFAVVAEAMGGLRHLMGEPGRVPVRAGVSLGDTLAALHGVIGVLLALQARQRSMAPEAPRGRGQVVTWRCTRPSSTAWKVSCPSTRPLARCASLPAPRCPASRRATPTRAPTVRWWWVAMATRSSAA
jgi:formyl-CoA transferase